jgi:hypothetical protein
MGAFFKLCVDFGDHPSHSNFTLADFGLHILGLAYANRHLTDGFLPNSAVRKMLINEVSTVAVDVPLTVAVSRAVEALLVSKKWKKVDGGFQIENFLEHNFSKKEVQKKIEHMRSLGSVAGRASAKSREVQKKSVNGKSTVAVDATVDATVNGTSTLRSTERQRSRSTSDPDPDLRREGSAGEPGRESSPSPESGQAENLTPPGKFDPGIGSNFAAGCLLAGYTVCPSNFAWKDLSAAAVAHWPSEKWPEKRQKLEAAAQRWAAGCDEFTRKSGYKHQAFVAWLNAGNAIDRNEIERLRTERSIAEQKIKRAAYELEKAAAAAQDIEDARLRSLGLPDSWAGLVPT